MKNKNNTIPKVDHFAFQVSDLERSIQFYCVQLGLNLLSKSVDEEHGEAFAFIELAGGNLELLQLLSKEGKSTHFMAAEIKPPYCPHLAIATDNIHKLVETLGHQHIAIIHGPLEIPNLVRWLYIADPDGNIIEYVQWLAKPKSPI